MVEHRPHGASHSDPDPELSLRGIVWTAVGVVVVTAVSMVLMWWMGGGMIAGIERAQGPLTPAERQAVEAVRRAGEERLEAGERPDLPELVLPADLALPPSPRLETTPTGDIGRLRSRESEILESWGWADESAGTVHVPIDEAIGLALSGGLPGVRLDSMSAPAATDAAAADDAGCEDGEVRDAA